MVEAFKHEEHNSPTATDSNSSVISSDGFSICHLLGSIHSPRLKSKRQPRL
jgi:hypothetical protein